MTYVKEEIASRPDGRRMAAEPAGAPGRPGAGERVRGLDPDHPTRSVVLT